MAYALPSIPDFKSQFVRDFPFAVPLSGGGYGARVDPVLGGANNGLAGLTLVDGGYDYPAKKVPSIIIYGGGGVGARASLTVTSGEITAVALILAGYGYTFTQSPPTVYISNGEGDNTDIKSVTDYDIVAAFNAARAFNMTQSLLSSQQTFTYAYNLLTAHYLCENIRAGGAGLNGKAEWLTNAKTVGNVTESFSIPDRVLKSPYLSKLSKTMYGAQFLELMSPQLIGNMASYHRQALPA